MDATTRRECGESARTRHRAEASRVNEPARNGGDDDDD